MFFFWWYYFALLFPKERKKTSDFYNATDLELKFEVKEVSYGKIKCHSKIFKLTFLIISY